MTIIRSIFRNRQAYSLFKTSESGLFCNISQYHPGPGIQLSRNEGERRPVAAFLDAGIYRVFNALVIYVLLYGSETWTLLKANERRLEAFHMNCQRRILGTRWFHVVTNASVTSQTGEKGLTIRICRRRLFIFGHVRRLATGSDTSPLRTTPGCGHSGMQAVNRTSGLSGSASEDDPT